MSKIQRSRRCRAVPTRTHALPIRASAPQVLAALALAAALVVPLSAQAQPDWTAFAPSAAFSGVDALIVPSLSSALATVDLETLPAAARKPARRPAEMGGPSARANWFYSQRAYPLREIPEGARLKALAQAEKIDEIKGRAKAGASSLWTLVGPTGVNSNIEPTWGRISGRVRALAIDASNSNRLLLGTATGGVWLSNDAGANWTPLTDNQPSLAIGAVAIDPTNPNVFYAGTGEGNGNYYGVGILKSVDGGASWSVLGAQQFARGAISDIAISPTNGSVVLVCARDGKTLDGGQVGNNVGGIYRSTNGGQSFTRTSASFCTGLAVVRSNFNLMYYSATGIGAGNGLYQSTDAGATWNQVSGAVNGEDVQRLAIGLSNDGSRIYIGGQQASDVILQRSTDGGVTWSTPTMTPIPESVEEADPLLYCESQCDYDNVIAVNPFDADDVYYGGVGIFRSRDGASSFNQVGANNSGGGPLHVDHHVVKFDPSAQGVVYNGNDGGIYRSSDGGANWTPLSGTLSTLQHYHVSLHPTNPAIFFTGNQDNGTTRRTNSNIWTEVGGGDGGYSAIDFSNTQIVYSSTTELNLQKSTDGGSTFPQNVSFQRDDGEPVGFIAPLLMDPLNSSLLYGGTNRLWRTLDGGANWAPFSTNLTSSEGASLTQIAIARSDTSVIYTTATDGSVGRGSGGNFAIVSSAPLPNRYATSLAVHPTDPNTVYVGFSGFNSATASTPGHVFKSTNGGDSWSNVSANLPDGPVNAVAIRPDQPSEVYVGTDVGVFISLDGGGSWAKMSNGLPNAPVAALAVNGTTNLLAAATYGRSVWTTPLASGTSSGPQDQPQLLGAPLPAPVPPNASCPGGFFIAAVDDGPGQGLTNGIYGLELLLDDPGTRLLNGGLNFGGQVDVSQDGFAAANIANAAGENQRLNVSLTGLPADDPNGSLPVRVIIERRTASSTTTVFETSTSISQSPAFETSIVVPPGFYVARLVANGFPQSAAGGPAEGQFFFSLTSSFVDRPGGGFQGGAVVGGYHAINPFGGVSGFAAFCIATPHNTTVRVFSAPTYGPTGARDLRLRILDANQVPIYTVPEG